MQTNELRDQLGKAIDAAYFSGEITWITKNGERRAALVPIDIAERGVQPGAEASDDT